MILKETLKKTVELQKAEIKEKELGIKRELLTDIDLNVPHATILSGIRRCGKSTLLRQIMQKTKNFHYFNFEDPRAIKFEISDFEKLNDSLKEVNGDCDYYFFDEIQNVDGWERFVRKLLDSKKKCIITGSNASLLSKELGTKLTGRHLTYELFPFSYEEMLKLIRKKPSLKLFEIYFEKGGFPDYLKYNKIEILQNLFSDIVDRDVVVRHNLKDEKSVKRLALYLLTNIGKEFSYNKLTKYFKFGSTNSVISYINYFEDSYLLFTIPRFDYSLKKQLVHPKKIYTIDVGFSNANSASFSEDKGRILENLVYLHLRKKNKNIFYFKEKGECDFVVKERERIVKALQVCYNLTEDNKDREIGGLKEAMEKFKLSQGTIVTFNQEDKIGNIKVIPIWKWLLE